MTQLNEKTIIRRQHDKENPYFMMAREAAQNRILSYEAVGVLAYLLSRPDDWKIIVSDLQREGCGRDKTLRILKELTDAGHLYRERGRDEKGHFVYGDYVVSERPLTEKPYTAEPLPDEPYTANPHLHNTELTEDRSGIEKISPPVPENPPRPHNAMFDAVSWAWRNTSGGYVGKLIAFLTGRCKPKDGKYHTHMIRNPMTPLEVVAFRLWRDYHELDMPKLPETIERLVEEFRGVPEYDRLLEAAAQHEIRHAPRQANEVTEGNAAPEFDTPDVPVVRDVNSVLDGVLAQLGGG